MSFQSLEGYFASARERWLEEQRAIEVEAKRAGLTPSRCASSVVRRRRRKR